MTTKSKTANFTLPINSGLSLLAVKMKRTGQIKSHLSDEPSQDPKLEKLKKKAKIYMIGLRPRVNFMPDSICSRSGDENVRGLLEIHRGRKCEYSAFELMAPGLKWAIAERAGTVPIDQVVDVDFSVKVSDRSAAELEFDGQFILTSGERVRFHKPVNFEIDELAVHFLAHHPEFHDIEVWYVGQSKDVEIRLSEHKKMIKAYHKAGKTHDLDIVLFYFDFEAEAINLNKRQDIPMPSWNIVDLIEGGIIFHYKPVENWKDKEKFPHFEPTRNDLVQLGFEHLAIEINQDNNGYRFYSNTREPKHFTVIAQHFDDESKLAEDRTEYISIDAPPPEPSYGWGQLEFSIENPDYRDQAKREIAMDRFSIDFCRKTIGLDISRAEEAAHLSKRVLRSVLPASNRLNNATSWRREPRDRDPTERILESLRTAVEPSLRAVIAGAKMSGTYLDFKDEVDRAYAKIVLLTELVERAFPDARCLLQYVIRQHLLENNVKFSQRQLENLPFIVRAADNQALSPFGLFFFVQKTAVISPERSFESDLNTMLRAFHRQAGVIEQKSMNRDIGNKRDDEPRTEPAATVTMRDDASYTRTPNDAHPIQNVRMGYSVV